VEDLHVVKYTHRYLNPLPADKYVEEVMTREVVTLSPDMSVQKPGRKCSNSYKSPACGE